MSIWFHNRVGKPKGRIRRIAIVAVARKLLIALWRYLESGLVPDGATEDLIIAGERNVTDSKVGV